VKKLWTPRAPGLSFLAAAVWSIGATTLFQLIVLLAFAFRPGAEVDIVAGVACQAAAYLLALYVFARVYEPRERMREIVAFRRADASLCGLAALAGVALQFPASALGELIEKQWPYSSAELLARAQHLEAITPGKQVAVFVSVCLVGPLVEELFFRGALFRGLRQRNTPGMTTFGVAAFFAAAHQDGRVFLPILLVGLAMTHLRALSGSILPAIVLHVTFNAAAIVPTLGQPIELETFRESVGILPAVLGTTAAAGLLYLANLLGRHSPRAIAARAYDEAA